MIITTIMIRLLYKKSYGWLSDDNQTLPLNLYHSYLAMKIFTQIHKGTKQRQKSTKQPQNDIALTNN